MFNKTLINFRPFFFLAVSIALGIGAGFSFYFDRVWISVLLIAVFLIFTAFVILFSGDSLKGKLIFGVIFLAIFIFGAGAFCLQVSRYDSANLDEHYYSVYGKVTSAYQTDYGQALTVEQVRIEGDRTGKLKYGISVSVFGSSEFRIGDLVQFDGYLSDIGSVYEERFSSDNIERGIKYNATVSADKIVKTGEQVGVFENVSLYMRNSINNGMGDMEASVAMGLLLGDTSLMEAQIVDSYRSAGVAHIFAVSGLHIGFLATALKLLMKRLKISRLIKAIIITAVLFFYAGVCGFSASSLRASVMCAVLLFSSALGMRYDGLSSVGLACALLLIISPVQMFCVGFQLSFAVVLGVLLLSSPISRLFCFLPRKFAQALGVVISAQIVGIPICLYAFGQFSTIAIIANLIFVPIVGVIFALVFLAVLIGGTGCAKVALFIPNYIFKIINLIITAVDYEFFIVGGITIGVFAIFYYLAVVLPCGLINLKKGAKLVALVVCALTCAVGATTLTVSESKLAKAYVIGDSDVCATVIKNADENIMIISNAQNAFSTSKFKRLASSCDVEKIDALIFTCGVSDVQSAVGRLNAVFELDKVFYYGETYKETEQIINRVFALFIKAFNVGEKLPTKTECFYSISGYAVECNINGVGLAIISELDSEASLYKDLSADNDYIVASDYLELIESEYNPKEIISYRRSLSYKNAQTQGRLSLKLK